MTDARRGERVLWAALVAVNLVTHFALLGERAQSHDESMHAFYSYELATRGVFRHDPMMHGPWLFHSTALVFLLLGASDFTSRLLQAMAGVSLVPALWLYRRYLGRAGALLAALLVTISPSILFYGRYARNDITMALLGLVWVYGALRYHETREPRFLYLVTGAMSVSFCAKETAFISGATFGAFFAMRAAWRALRGRERLRESPGAHLAVLMLTLVLPFLTALVHVLTGWNPAEFDSPESQARALVLVSVALAVSAVLAFAWSLRAGPRGLPFRTWLRLAAVFWTLPLLLFTTFFTNAARGLTSGVVGSLGYWLGQQEVARGGQPWFYYLLLSVVYEPLALLASLAGLLLWLVRRPRTEPPFVPLCAFWVVASVALYSWAGEKMPWLLVHIALPMSLLAAWTLSRLWVLLRWSELPRLPAAVLLALPLAAVGAAAPLLVLQPEGRSLEAAAQATRVMTHVLLVGGLLAFAWRAARRRPARSSVAATAMGLALLLGLYTFRSALRLTFVNGDLATELLVYAHGTPDIKRTMREIEEIAARTGEGAALEVAYDDDSTWPLNWYLRGFPRQRYLGEAIAPPELLAPVVMIGSKNIEKAEPHLEQDYVRRNYRLIWWPPEDYMRSGLRDLWRALADPGRRLRLVRYLLLRETGYELSDWPLRHDFTLFIRRDLAQRAWPLGLDARAAPAPAAAPRFECAAQKVIEGPFEGLMLQAPAAVAVASDGRRLIADTGGHRIVVLDRDDAFVRAFGGLCDLSKGAAGGCSDPDGPGARAAGDGQLLEPWGVAEGPEGGTLVADTWNGRVVSFDAAGGFVRSWGRLSTGTSQRVEADLLYGPRGIAYHAARRTVALADTGHKRVLLYSPEGLLQRELGGPGQEAGRFDEPVGLAFGVDGSLFVADAWNRRIQRFDSAMKGTGVWPASAWGSRAPTDKPYVAASRSGVVYASDPAGGRVLVYSPDGTLVATIDGPGWSAPVRVRPAGLAVDDARGLLLVADTARSRVWSLAVSDRPDRPCRDR